MIRSIWWFIFFFSYVIYSLPKLKKVNNLSKDIPVEERDKLVHDTPKKWARALVELTKSTVTVTGQHHIPNGAVLFVSNHQGNFDVPILIGYLEKPLGFISKVEVKKIPLIPRWMEAMNCVFIDRSDRRKAIQSIRDGAQLLKNGHSLVLFPEGTRSKGEEMGEFKSGGLRLAIDSRVPIVPVCISDSYKIMEVNKFGFSKADVSVKLGEPIFLPAEGKIDSSALAEQIQNKIVELQNEKVVS
ncbi:lysophospholipid acyltransferase family protein [Bacillus sp. FJAT-45066]|uniref:lysophospholipid acyltransferase family protein n=1 Tax=Bacillus sp. FJAT-45066 TaxID=2011010 RepID=UPI000BB8B239|nr:lysophospholipid acyltransferase family protein [Bacillus sp. FJAT-45066]